MNQRAINIISSILVIAVIGFAIYFFTGRENNSQISDNVLFATSTANVLDSTNVVSKTDDNGTKTFVFDNFHGIKNISQGFTFTYPSVWYNEGQYFSPNPITHYDLYSVKAPFYFDLVLASIFKDTELKNQIDSSKRKSPDSHGKIDGENFERYDLIDYGTYGGDSAGRVVIYLGPKILIDGLEYYLVFHWEEKPLTVAISGNDEAIFEKSVFSLKFTK